MSIHPTHPLVSHSAHLNTHMYPHARPSVHLTDCWPVCPLPHSADRLSARLFIHPPNKLIDHSIPYLFNHVPSGTFISPPANTSINLSIHPAPQQLQQIWLRTQNACPTPFVITKWIFAKNDASVCKTMSSIKKYFLHKKTFVCWKKKTS